jgi:hypothetical protein
MAAVVGSSTSREVSVSRGPQSKITITIDKNSTLLSIMRSIQEKTEAPIKQQRICVFNWERKESDKPLYAQDFYDRHKHVDVAMWLLRGDVIRLQEGPDYSTAKGVDYKLDESPKISEAVYNAQHFVCVPCLPIKA